MEPEEEDVPNKESKDLTVDFSKQSLKKIEKAVDDQVQAVSLILDYNEIQRLDNVDTYINLKKLSLVNNQLVRMYGVTHLVNLETLNLSENSLVTIEGLKDLKDLKHLILAKNKIKTIEHLNNNLNLEKIDVSDNYIVHISDISYLESLKELNLHGNKISHLRQCEKNLPESIEILTLNNNLIYDLNEISYLVNLISLKELSIANNPCVDFAEDLKRFNYRPFVKNWCSSLITLDNCPLDDIECLKAEWLYSQGRGRSFKPGEHATLVEYLSSVCPKKAEPNAENEDVKKLKLILSKAQQHQQQLREQLSTEKLGSPELYRSPQPRKKPSRVPERMVASFQDSSVKDFRYSPELMTRSLDSGMLKNSPPSRGGKDSTQASLQASSTFIPIPDSLISPDLGSSFQPFIATRQRPSSISSRSSRSSSRNPVPSTPESKRKTSSISRRQSQNTSPVTPKKQTQVNSSRSSTPLKSSSSRNTSSSAGRASSLRELEKNCRETSEEEDSEILALRILSIQQKVGQGKGIQKRHPETPKGRVESKESFKEKVNSHLERHLAETKAWKAAVCIQKHWRGYRARNLNGDVLTACRNIQMNRMQDYITKVVSDMEATRIALEGNRKLQVLQMQAINALWKKITAIQPDVSESASGSKVSLQNLMETCSTLNKQVEGLQAMMRTMQKSSFTSSIPIATQTEIVAVHTPQGEAKDTFPYDPTLKPRSNEQNASSSTRCLDDDQARESLDSENGSNSETATTVTELYNNCISKESSKIEVRSLPDSQEQKETIVSVDLTKPSVKLSQVSCDIPTPFGKEREEAAVGNEGQLENSS